MSLKRRINRIEAIKPRENEVHFFGWADCEWKSAGGLVRRDGEAKDEFLRRVGALTRKKWIWVD